MIKHTSLLGNIPKKDNVKGWTDLEDRIISCNIAIRDQEEEFLKRYYGKMGNIIRHWIEKIPYKHRYRKKGSFDRM